MALATGMNISFWIGCTNNVHLCGGLQLAKQLNSPEDIVVMAVVDVDSGNLQIITFK